MRGSLGVFSAGPQAGLAKGLGECLFFVWGVPFQRICWCGLAPVRLNTSTSCRA